MNCIVPALFLAVCAWFIPGLLKVQEERAEARLLVRCGLLVRTPTDELQAQLQDWITYERARLQANAADLRRDRDVIARRWELRRETAWGEKKLKDLRRFWDGIIMEDWEA